VQIRANNGQLTAPQGTHRCTREVRARKCITGVCVVRTTNGRWPTNLHQGAAHRMDACIRLAVDGTHCPVWILCEQRFGHLHSPTTSNVNVRQQMIFQAQLLSAVAICLIQLPPHGAAERAIRLQQVNQRTRMHTPTHVHVFDVRQGVVAGM